jgi:CheY-like chemotaxis protein
VRRRASFVFVSDTCCHVGTKTFVFSRHWGNFLDVTCVVMSIGARTVLVVEDDLDSRVMLSTALEFEGYDVVTATNGMEAFNVARRHNPCVIVLDLMMPVMTGEEFRAAQVADAGIRRIPVLVLSAHHDAVAIAKRMKAAGCLTKPVDFDALAELIKKRCGA